MGIATHLVVLVHGFQGSKQDWDNFVKCIKSHPASSSVYMLPIESNGGLRTMDGISIGAQRVYREVVTLVESMPSLNRISIVGHSMGGIYGRILAKLLDEAGIFDNLQPYIFATFATPHLGIRRPPKTPFNITVQTIAGAVCRSTSELSLKDGGESPHNLDPLLYRMSMKEYTHSLSKFRRRVAYSNVFNDLQVPYGTGAIRRENPYRKSTQRKVAKMQRKIQRRSKSEGGTSSNVPAHGKQSSFKSLNSVLDRFHKKPSLHAASDTECSHGTQATTDSVADTVHTLSGVASSDAASTSGVEYDERQAQSAVELQTSGSWYESVTSKAPKHLLSKFGTPRRRKTCSAAPLDRSTKYPSITVWSLAHVHTRKRSAEIGLDDTNIDNPGELNSAVIRDIESVKTGISGGLHTAFRHDQLKAYLQAMLQNLDALGWERYDVVFNSLFAHEQIIGKRAWLSGIDVVQHFANDVLLASVGEPSSSDNTLHVLSKV